MRLKAGCLETWQPLAAVQDVLDIWSWNYKVGLEVDRPHILTAKILTVGICSRKWNRRESNPCPKALLNTIVYAVLLLHGFWQGPQDRSLFPWKFDAFLRGFWFSPVCPNTNAYWSFEPYSVRTSNLSVRRSTENVLTTKPKLRQPLLLDEKND